MKVFFKLPRTIEVIEVPSGLKNLLPAGTKIRITQALGNKFTIATEKGYMSQVQEKDLDALGEDNLAKAKKALHVEPSWSLEKKINHLLRTVYDPEVPVNIVDLGLIYSQKLTPQQDQRFLLHIEMTLTAPGCGMGPVMVQDLKEKLKSLPELSQTEVSLVFQPAWDRSKMSDAAKLELGLF